MNWFYSDNGAQQGPISDMDLVNLTRNGTLKPETLVWHDGMTDWQPLSVTRPDLVSVPDSVPNIGGVAVPELKKDLVVQQIREGAYESAFGATNPYGLNYAGFWIRLAAKMIDMVVLMVVIMAIGFILFGGLFALIMDPKKMEQQDPEAMMAFMGAYFAFIGINLGIQIAYNAVMVWKWGGTVGKLAVGIRVVREDGASITFGRALGRAFADFLNGFACHLTYLMVAFDEPQKRSLQDHICGTRVVTK